jgi:hypothetical protein
MSEKFAYQIQNDAFIVTVTESAKTVRLTNFKAEITKEETVIHNTGKSEIFLYIQGQTDQGKPLEEKRISIHEFDKTAWFRKLWGSDVVLNQQYISNSLRQLNGKPMYLFQGAALSLTGFQKDISAKLPAELNFYSYPEDSLSPDDVKNSVTQLLNLMRLSKENKLIEPILCLTAFRAMISIWLPNDFWLFLAGNSENKINGLAKIIQSFFGVLPGSIRSANWDMSKTELETLAKAAKNSVYVVNNFKYPDE